MKVTDQLTHWSGQFGNAYTNRNAEDPSHRLPIFREILSGLSLDRVLEVGCNRGYNLITFSQLLGDVELFGIEPNRYAIEIARQSGDRIKVLPGNVFCLPFEDEYFDMVLTAGVLIHIALPDLSEAIREIYRVSRRYVLAIEYYADIETEIPYRGRNDLLWKRDFLRYYKEEFPDLRLIRTGYWEWNESNWWLLEKEPRG